MPMRKKHPILLKLSGESLGLGGIQNQNIQKVVQEILPVARQNSLAIVIGGGNIWRWRDHADIQVLTRVQSDFLGMLATVFNANVLAGALRSVKISAQVFSAVDAPKELAQKYTVASARRALNSNQVIILAGGTGKSGVTTDSGAARRAVELGCEEVFKATTVRGIFSADPKKDSRAVFLPKVTFREAIQKKYGVMDRKAFQILAKKKIPITIFDFSKKGLLLRAVKGEKVGSRVED